MLVPHRHRLIALFFAFIALGWVVPGNALHTETHTESDNSIIVDAPWLLNQLHDKNLLIIDARPAEQYMAGHIKGAVNLPVESTFRQANTGSKVAGLQVIQQLFRQAGIRRDQTVVIYDNDEHIAAGRLFWVLEVFGHPKVKILNGGYSNWKASGYPSSKQLPKTTASEYIATIEPQYLATKLDVQLALNDNSKQLIDARKKEEYQGIKSKASRFGHILGAVNIPVELALQKGEHGNLIKPLAELERLYSNIDKDKKVYLYCNRGKHASLSYAILRQLGYDAAHYDGSWIEWGNNPDLPVEKNKQH